MSTKAANSPAATSIHGQAAHTFASDALDSSSATDPDPEA